MNPVCLIAVFSLPLRRLCRKNRFPIQIKHQHQIHHAWVGRVVKGGVHCISFYLCDGEDASDDNLEILAEAAALIKTLEGPWIAAGDFNMSPSTLASTNWPKMVGGTIIAPTPPTCLSQTYDYLVVSNGLRSAVEQVQTLDDSGLYPHSPSRIYIRADARRHAIRTLKRLIKVPGRLPHGPPIQPPSYERVICLQLQKSGRSDHRLVPHSEERALGAHWRPRRLQNSQLQIAKCCWAMRLPQRRRHQSRNGLENTR